MFGIEYGLYKDKIFVLVNHTKDKEKCIQYNSQKVAYGYYKHNLIVADNCKFNTEININLPDLKSKHIIISYPYIMIGTFYAIIQFTTIWDETPFEAILSMTTALFHKHMKKTSMSQFFLKQI